MELMAEVATDTTGYSQQQLTHHRPADSTLRCLCWAKSALAMRSLNRVCGLSWRKEKAKCIEEL